MAANTTLVMLPRQGNGSNPNDPSTSTVGLTHTTSVFTGPTTKNGSEKVGNERVMKEVPSSYANKHNPTSSSKANLRIFEANVPNDADYDVWLLLASIYEVNDIMKILISVTSLEKDLLSPLWNGFDNLVMAVPNLEGTGYTKEYIRVEYEWKPPRCSTCLIFGHSLDDFSKAPKRVVNKMDKGKGGSSGDTDECFIEVKKKKSCEWRESYVDADYDPYDDDMHECQEVPDNIQSICDNLDIKVRCRKKK
ncbi:hypothetical protein Tco_0880612 [Tanacetum coccineum]